jgi:hypothetical protein
MITTGDYVTMGMLCNCYVGDCFVGELNINNSGGFSFVWKNEDHYTEAAFNYRKFVDLSSDEKIKVWMGERVIDENRTDRSLWLSMAGIPLGGTKLDVFLGADGRSINDDFWISCKTQNEV